MRICIIIAETGNFNDYSTHNICVTSSSNIAEKYCNFLNLAIIARNEFYGPYGMYQKYKAEWIKNNPKPPIFYSEPFVEDRPSSKDKEKRTIEIETYAKKLADTTLANLLKENEYRQEHNKWFADYESSLANFAKENLNISHIFPEDIRDKLMKLFSEFAAESFFYEEIDYVDDEPAIIEETVEYSIAIE
jgi:hypothetical protein